MRTGFSFNGKHTSEFKGVTVRTKDRPIFPLVKEQVYSADNMNGEYDFTDISGHEYFNARNFQMEFAVVAENLRELQKKMSALSNWFKGRGTLIFSDLPLVKWNGRIIDSVSYMPEHGGHSAVLSVTYKVQPFSELIFDVINGPYLDMDIPLDSDIPLDGAEYLTFNGTGTYTNVPNVGDVHVKPVITVTGSTGIFTIGNNGVNITVKHQGNFIIDCKKEIVYNGNTSLMKDTAGAFFELAPDTDNTITIIGTGTAQINYIPQFLYDATLDNMDWGDK